MKNTITQSELLDIIRQRVEQSPSKAEFARGLKISPQYLNDILNESRPISDEVARKLGYTLEKVYRKLD